MKDRKVHIEVQATKTNQWRARIAPGKGGDEFQEEGLWYEVTVGGDMWNKGKGREYENTIRRLIERKLLSLMTRYCLSIAKRGAGDTIVTVNLLQGSIKHGRG